MTSITEIRNTLHQMQKRELLQHGEYKGKSWFEYMFSIRLTIVNIDMEETCDTMLPPLGKLIAGWESKQAELPELLVQSSSIGEL